ncbi:NAD-P-binding protein [Hysterangium stoloniferum]|nr:NAD-P-binding protein [Hysterangium stoloniferum]
MASKPSVVVFGGLHTAARALGSYLVPDEGEPLVSHIRFVDKYSVQPATTYLGARFPKLLQKPIVEYHQANLTKEGPVTKCFDPPEGIEPFSYVFDMTGQVHIARAVELHIEQTAIPAFLIGQEAQRRKVRAYVRITQPYYQTSLEKTAHPESDVIKPSDPVGTWYHEALRILANFQDLNLVIIRPGLIYGPWVISGIITPFMLLGLVYRELETEFRSLWSPQIRHNTIHVEDVAAASWAAAEWMGSIGRAEANKIAGEDIYFANDKAKIQDVKGAPDQKAKLTAPLFNLVDDTDTTLQTISTTIGTTFDIKTSFHGVLHNTLAQLTPENTLEEINETHLEAWNRLIAKAHPPVPNTPLNPYMEAYMLEKRSFAYKGGKIQKILGYELRHPKFGVDTIRGVIDSFKEEGVWPNVPELR